MKTPREIVSHIMCTNMNNPDAVERMESSQYYRDALAAIEAERAEMERVQVALRAFAAELIKSRGTFRRCESEGGCETRALRWTYDHQFAVRLYCDAHAPTGCLDFDDADWYRRAVEVLK
jgi:hypothetical protein